MRVPGVMYLLLMVWMGAGVRGGAEPARAIEPLKLRIAGKTIDLPMPALYDGREVYLPLDAARAMQCKVVMPDKEDYAIIASPHGVRREIGLARLCRAPMIPLTSLTPLLGIQFSVSQGYCDIRYLTPQRATAPPAEHREPARSARPTPAAAGGPTKTGGGAGAQTVLTQPGGVQSADPVEPDTTAGAASLPGRGGGPATPVAGARSGGDRSAAPVVAPLDDTPAAAPTPPKRGSERTASWLVDVVCEAIDPAQTRLLLVAEGPIKPSVRMTASLGELTVDLPGTAVASSQTEWTFANPLVAGARVVSGPMAGVTRVIFTLRRLVTYRDRPAPPDGHEILVRLPKLVGRRFEEMRIMVDPGHGGPSATGCSAMVGGRRIYEKDLNLAIARKVVDRLRSSGLSVSMTRSSDAAVSLSERPALANAMPADVFVSIHVDDAPGNSRASGPTAYYHASDENSRALGLSIVEGVAAAGGLPSRGARSDLSRFRTGMAVLKRAEMSAVLIEVAYISNPGDRAKLITAEFQAKVAAAIADGIRRYVEGRLPAAVPESGADQAAVQEPEGP